MSNLVLVEGEVGDPIDFTITEKGLPKDLTAFDSGILVIRTDDEKTIVKTIILTILAPATSGKVRWNLLAVDIPAAGSYRGQIILTGTGITRKTWPPMSISVGRRYD